MAGNAAIPVESVIPTVFWHFTLWFTIRPDPFNILSAQFRNFLLPYGVHLKYDID
jgi:hypothetical protein